MSARSALQQEKEFAFSEENFHFLKTLVYEQTGIVLAEHKRDMVYSRLARRLRALGLKDFAQYCALVEAGQEQGEGELGNLVNAITTNLTSFFREPHHFEHLREEVLRPLLAGNAKRLRIWSAGCSSGMEPYSLAMTVKSVLPAASRCDARILATDIDTNMLAMGGKGHYPLSELENIPAQFRSRIGREAGQIRMPEELRSLIAFKHLNLLDDWPMKGPFDAVFCRNVVIYFDKPTQMRLFARIAEMLVPGGWLYIGHSENIATICDRFEACGRTIYRRIR